MTDSSGGGLAIVGLFVLYGIFLLVLLLGYIIRVLFRPKNESEIEASLPKPSGKISTVHLLTALTLLFCCNLYLYFSEGTGFIG